jgi:hypothetical protein
MSDDSPTFLNESENCMKNKNGNKIQLAEVKF